MKVYVIKHGYDVDSGYGDAVYTEEILHIVADEQTAIDYCKKWDKPYVYFSYAPYADLTRNHVFYEEMNVLESLDVNTIPPKTSFYSPGERKIGEDEDYDDED